MINERCFHHYFNYFEKNYAGWCELKNLKQLDLSGNNLEDLLLDCLDELKNLEQLDFSKNNIDIDGLFLEVLRNLSPLQLLTTT